MIGPAKREDDGVGAHAIGAARFARPFRLDAAFNRRRDIREIASPSRRRIGHNSIMGRLSTRVFQNVVNRAKNK